MTKMADVIRIGHTDLADPDHAKLRVFFDQVLELALAAGVASYVVSAEWDTGHAGGTCVHANGAMSQTTEPGTDESVVEAKSIAKKLCDGVFDSLERMVEKAGKREEGA